MKHYLAPTLAACIALGFAVEASGETGTLNQIRSSYDTCQKTGGDMPEFFESAKVNVDGDTVTFATKTKEHGVIEMVWDVDGIVRRGEDHHHLTDGTVLPFLPAHEATFWKDGSIVREEVTFLPDNTFVLETNTLTIAEDGALDYKLELDGTLLLSATCS